MDLMYKAEQFPTEFIIWNVERYLNISVRRYTSYTLLYAILIENNIYFMNME